MLGQGLADAVLYSASLARKATALDCCDDVILAFAFGNAEGLVDDETQRRTCEINFLITAIDRDLARARLYPHAGNSVFTTARGVGTALRVNFTFTQRSGRSSRRDRCFGSSFNSWCSSSRGSGSVGELTQIGERLTGIGVGHYAPTLFLRFSEPTSMTLGFWAACGCSVPE